jgi:hypothetical protein
MEDTKYTPGADKLGIASAVVCTIHCLLVPLLFLVKYWLSASGNADHLGLTSIHHGDRLLPSWWETLDYVFLVVSFVAVYHAASHAAGKWIKISLWLFWLCFAIAIFFEASLHWLAYLSSAGLVATHFINIRRHRLSM